MGVLRKIGSVGKHIVDVRVDKWIGYDFLKTSFIHTGRSFKTLFQIKKATYTETFEEAIHRLGLNEQTLIARKREFIRLAIIFVLFACGILGYAIYLASQKQLVGCAIAFLFSLYALVNAFRFHFWFFQMQHRKLGCTFQEWLNGGIQGE